jgi:hypothetical protein
MAIADDNNGQWLTPAQATTPRYTIDTRRRCAIPPGAAEIEKRQHELVDDLRAARRWRVRWRDGNKEGPWQEGGIPPHWWTHDAVKWSLGLLMRRGRALWVQISDDDDQTTTEPVAPTIDAAALPPAAEQIVVVRAPPVRPTKGPRSSKLAIEAEGERLMLRPDDYPTFESLVDAVHRLVKAVPSTKLGRLRDHLRPIYKRLNGAPK